MSKQVVSFRMSKEELAALDEVCRRLKINRSEVVNAGILVLLKNHAAGDGSLLRRAPWFLTTVTGAGREES
jgi:hypothetical protein